MKMLFRHAVKLISLSVMATLAVASCGGGGGTPPTTNTTTVSGWVKLSSTVGSKPGQLFAVIADQPLPGATIQMYNADRPEWLYPVAEVLSDSSGNYTLNKLTYSTQNGNAYNENGAIPTGNYTVIASKNDTMAGRLYVAVQAYVKKFDGPVTGNDLIAQDRGVTPSVLSMLGLPNNPDGTFGGPTTELAANAAIQVTFNTAMARLRVLGAVSIKDDTTNSLVQGTWKVSADLLSATFYPASALPISKVYTVTVIGGTNSDAALNLFGNPVPQTVTGSFMVVDVDDTPPNAISITQPTNVPITGPVQIASNEPLDVNTFAVASTPSIGDKPAVLYIGKRSDPLYPYVYEIVTSGLLELNTNYAITVSGTKDMAGIQLTTMTFNFKTQTSKTQPTVKSTNPTANAANIAVNVVISATFSGTMDPRTIDTTTILVSNGTATIQGTASCNGTTATFIPTSNLAYDTSYTVTITPGVQDAAGTALAAPYVWSFRTALPVPFAPTGLTGSAGSSQATISWNAVSEVAAYHLYWSTTAGVTKTKGTKISDVTSPYIHSNLTNGTAYYYIVTAENGSGESAESSEVSATPAAVVPITSAPTGVSSSSGGDSQVTISWSASPGATSYNIYWSTNSANATKTAGTGIAAASSPHVQTGLTNGTTYYYVVTAVNAAGESAASAVSSATPSLAPPPPPPQ